MLKTVATATTRACAASSHTLPVIRTTAKTAVVISAPKRGPLGSMSILRCPFGDSGGWPAVVAPAWRAGVPDCRARSRGWDQWRGAPAPPPGPRPRGAGGRAGLLGAPPRGRAGGGGPPPGPPAHGGAARAWVP